jgi:hypothetical protein
MLITGIAAGSDGNQSNRALARRSTVSLYQLGFECERAEPAQMVAREKVVTF